MDSEPVVGIDLGTTFSSVAYHDGQKTILIQDNFGNRIIPSLVYFDHQTGKVSVGEEADKNSVKYNTNLIRDAKRFIGRMYNDEFVLKYSSMESGMKVERGKNDMAAFAVTINGTTVIKSPEEISAEILRYLIGMADNFFRKKIARAVISVPAYFSNSQKKATKKAAELMGLQVLKLITEPTAGALHYMNDKKSRSKVMVFDWGGGTLDLSFIEVKDGAFEVKAVYGDSLLGGRDIDEKLYDHFNKQCKIHRDKFFRRRLLNCCVNLKKVLTVEHEAENELTSKKVDEKEYIMNLTREDFERIMKDIFDRIDDIVKYAVFDCGWSASQINQVVLVGGSSRINRICEILQDIFGPDKIRSDLNPDEAVAAGAAIQAYLLSSSMKHCEKIKVSELTPLSLGLSVKGDLFVSVIKRNTPIPAMNSCITITTENNQIETVIEIYEGERKNSTYNNKLGSFIVSGLPPKRAGDVSINKTFSLNEDGILTVTATEDSTGVTNSLTVTMGEFRLSERKISYSLAEAEKRKNEDEVFKKFTRRRNVLERNCLHILYDIDKISDPADRNIVEEACDDFLEFSEGLVFTEIERLGDRYKIMYDKIHDILERSNMLALTYERR